MFVAVLLLCVVFSNLYILIHFIMAQRCQINEIQSIYTIVSHFAFWRHTGGDALRLLPPPPPPPVFMMQFIESKSSLAR